MKTTAELLVEELRLFHRRERPSPSDGDVVRKLLKDLENRGWISVYVSDKKGKYVLRNRVHGGPIMQKPGLSEIYFNSLDFTRACRDAYHAVQLGGEAPSILQVIE